MEYKSAGDGDESFQRPVMVHRAMLGSVERMTAVLTEHWGGKWPFWLSPRQCVIVPIDLKFLDYALQVYRVSDVYKNYLMQYAWIIGSANHP